VDAGNALGDIIVLKPTTLWADIMAESMAGLTSPIQTQLDGKQPLDSDLTTIAGLTPTTDNFMVATASAWASRTPTQARTQMGLGTLATQSGTFSGTSSGTNTGDQTSIVGITGTTAQFNTANTDSDFYTTGGTDVSVADGGTGRSTGTTAYSLVATGTTATGAQQTLANGATTEVLVGGGASALPVWTTATGSGAPVRATSPTVTTPTIAQINNATAPGVKLQLGTQTDNSNSIASATTAGLIVQQGWGQVVGGGAATLTDTVTFPTTFTTIMGVVISAGAASTGAAASITGLTTEYGSTLGIAAHWSDVTNSTVAINFVRQSGTFGTGTYYGYSWIAWGV